MAGSSTGSRKTGSGSSKSSSSKSSSVKKSSSKSGSSGKSSASKRSSGAGTSSRKGAGRSTGKRGGARGETSAVRRDITLIVMFAVTVFLFLCNFMSLGIVGTFFSNVMFGLTGAVAYALPIFIFAVYLYDILASGKDPYVVSRILGACGLLLIVMILLELISVDMSSQQGFDPVGIYTRSAQNRSGGGVIGGAAAFALYGLLRTVGTVLVLIVLAVACVYVIGQRSYLELFRDRAMDARLAREERIAAEERYREEHPEEFEDDFEDDGGEEYADVQPREPSHYEESRDRFEELRQERKIRRREKEEERRRQQERERQRQEEERADRILNYPDHTAQTARMGRGSSWNVDLSADDADAPPAAKGGIDLPEGFDREEEPASPQEGGGGFRNPSAGYGIGDVPSYSGYPEDKRPDSGFTGETSDDAGYSGETPFGSGAAEDPAGNGAGPVPENDDLHEIRPEDYDGEPEWNRDPLRDDPSGAAFARACADDGVRPSRDSSFPPDADYVTAVPFSDPERTGQDSFFTEPDSEYHPGPLDEEILTGRPDGEWRSPVAEDLQELPAAEREESEAESSKETGQDSFCTEPDSEDDSASSEEELTADLPAKEWQSPATGDLQEHTDRERQDETEAENTGTDFVPVHTERDGGESQITRALAEHQVSDEPAQAPGYSGAVRRDAASSAGLSGGGAAAAYRFPPMDLLRAGDGPSADTDDELRRTAHTLQTTLQNFGVNVTMTDISQGPSVTRYELLPEMGVKVSKIVSLADDIKLALAATDIRIEAPIPGKSAIGIEVPNREARPVMLRDILDTTEFRAQKSKLSFAVGKDIAGKPVYSDIAKMPHVLIAGATGSGKSVCINTIIISILYHARPDEVKFIMIDPKVVELSVYNGIPHLLIPVVTDPQKATAALNWAVTEMESRYRAFADARVREIRAYNALVRELDERGTNENHLKFMPQIVVIVDELADLMMVAKSDVETAICRLAQLARAAGIHLIIATQRPSVDVITGLIKANMPSRIAFRVSSGVDSRTILDMNGAEKLLGKGDMLFFPQGLPKPNRVQGGFVSDDEVNDVVLFLQNHYAGSKEEDDRQQRMLDEMGTDGAGRASSSGGSAAPPAEPEVDELFGAAGNFIIEKNNASIGLLQRRYRIGFNRAARIMDQLCDAGVVGESEGTKSRTILMTPADFAAYCREKEIPIQDML